MRVAGSIVLLALGLAVMASRAEANTAPSWNVVPAMVSFAMQPHVKALEACTKKRPLVLSMIASRHPKTGATKVAMPMPPVGGRGFTAEEKCLMKTLAKVSLPDLPPGIERVVLEYIIYATGVKPPPLEHAFDAWSDLPAAINALVDDKAKQALAACDSKARTVRVKLDLRKDATRVWLPAWQFHSAKRDGSTPDSQKKVKACIEKVIAGWQAPVLPEAMADVELAIAVSP